MKKFKIIMEKFLEKEVEAETEEEAIDIAWETWTQNDMDIYVYPIKEEDDK